MSRSGLNKTARPDVDRAVVGILSHPLSKLRPWSARSGRLIYNVAMGSTDRHREQTAVPEDGQDSLEEWQDGSNG